jgi:hypothetical protein
MSGSGPEHLPSEAGRRSGDPAEMSRIAGIPTRPISTAPRKRAAGAVDERAPERSG